MPTSNLNFRRTNVARYTPSAGQEFFYTLDHTKLGGFGVLIETDIDGISSSAYREYPLSVSLGGNQVYCLQYNGRYFYSLQINTAGSSWLSTIIRKWQLVQISGVWTLQFLSSRTYTNIKALTFALESYRLQITNFNGSNTFTVRTEDKFILSRLSEDDKVLVTTADGNDSYDGTIDYTDPVVGTFTFKSSVPNAAEYGSGDTAKTDVSLWIFDGYTTDTLNGSLVYERSTNNSFTAKGNYRSVLFSRVSSATCGIIEGESRINSSNRTSCLLFKNNHVVYITTPESPTNLLASPILPYNYSSDYCTPISTKALMLKTDYATNGNPRCLSLQNKERDPITTDLYSLNGYNVVEFKLFPYLAFMNTMLDRWTLVSGEITNCRCQVLDQYDFGLVGRNVHWLTDDPRGQFLGWPGQPDLNDTETDSNGVAYNQYQAGWLLPGDIVRGTDLNYNQIRYSITTTAIIT